MQNTTTTPSEEILWLEEIGISLERPIWEWKINDILTKPNYSIKELNELDKWIGDDINELFSNKNIWIEELQIFKNTLLWRLDMLNIDPNLVILKKWLTLQDYFYSIESIN
jgi:hypothetical protein